MTIRIRRLDQQADPTACDAAIDSNIPIFFGDEDGLREQRRAVREDPGIVAEVEGEVRGFLSLVPRNDTTAEITWMAVHDDWRGRGIATALVDAAAERAAADGLRLLSVMTLGEQFDESGQADGYFRTRAFYRRAGFLPVQELEDLWPGQPPVLLMVRPIGEGR